MYWLSFIDALIRLDKLADAKAVLDQAKSNGDKSDAFDKLEQKLNVPTETPIEGSVSKKKYPKDRAHTRTNESIEIYNKALAIKLDFVDALNNMGIILRGTTFQNPNPRLLKVIESLLDQKIYLKS